MFKISSKKLDVVLKVLWTFKNFFKLLLIEKPVMRETECLKPYQKIQNSYKVMKVSKFN